MYKGKILDLDNVSYLVLEETKYGSRNIVLLAVVDTEKDYIDVDNLAIKELVDNNGSLEVVSLENDIEITELSKLLGNKLISNL